MTPPLRRRAAALLASLALALLAACSTPLPTAHTPWLDGPIPPLLLLGETHDNQLQHHLRLQALRKLIERGARPALLMEQFDRERQGAIDALLARPAATSPAELDQRVSDLVALGGGTGWDWPLYRPVLRLLLQHGLPLVAANVSRSDARSIISQGLAANGFDGAVPADITRGQAGGIEASHCGMIDAATANRMASAQVARDQFMARQLVAHVARGVVLLAGNGHVRKDLGVPRWLPADLRQRTLVVGYLEVNDPTRAAYDQVVITPAQPREDPCAGMRKPAPLTASAG